MSKQSDARQRLERLSEDLADVQKQAEPGGISSWMGFGRRLRWGNKYINVVASAAAPKGVVVEFIDGQHIMGRTSYGANDLPMGTTELFQSSPYTVSKLAELVTGSAIERKVVPGQLDRVTASELDFVVGFFRDPQNDLLLARLRPQNVGEPLYGLHKVYLDNVSSARMYGGQFA